jgi:hypothetical protein
VTEHRDRLDAAEQETLDALRRVLGPLPERVKESYWRTTREALDRAENNSERGDHEDP